MQSLFNRLNLKKYRSELRKNQTVAERKLWQRLRSKRLEGIKFFRQYSVGPYILDFYCPKVRLGIELDGGQHSLEENQNYDLEPSSFLETNGIKVLRFWNNEVMRNFEGVLERIVEVFSITGTPPTPS